MVDIKQRIIEHEEVCKKLDVTAIAKLGEAISNCYNNHGKLLICGNGGSAADSQHFAAELVGRFIKERRALPAIALTANSSNLTAIGNDFGFDKVFERQVEGLGKKEDLLVVISTSGNSENLVKAVKKAQEIGMDTIALLGKNGGKLKGMCKNEIIVPSGDTQRIQEMHIFIIHLLCELIEEAN